MMNNVRKCGRLPGFSWHGAASVPWVALIVFLPRKKNMGLSIGHRVIVAEVFQFYMPTRSTLNNSDESCVKVEALAFR